MVVHLVVHLAMDLATPAREPPRTLQVLQVEGLLAHTVRVRGSQRGVCC